jgi:hypothetical protein
MDNAMHRWAPEMETETLKHHHWRKSSQWVALRRDHSQLIAADEELTDVFVKHCYREWRGDVWRDCYSDEHYLGTLLASKVCGACHTRMKPYSLNQDNLLDVLADRRARQPLLRAFKVHESCPF